MPVDHVEREVLIEAPIDVVWEVISQPEHLVHWFVDEAQVDLRPGGEGLLRQTSEHQASFRVRYETVEPPRRLSYRWIHPENEEPRPGNSTLVEFTLAEEGANTRLRVVESGIQLMGWPDDEKDEFSESHAEGWEKHLARLAVYAPTAVDGPVT